MADFIYLQCVQKINRDQNVFRNIFCKTQTIPMKFVHRFPNKVAKKGVFLPHYLNMSLHYLVKLEMLIGHVLPLSCYREKLQSLFHLNCSPQICQIWIQLITACGDYCKRRCKDVQNTHHWSGRTETATENGVGQDGSCSYCGSHLSVTSSIGDGQLCVFCTPSVAIFPTCIINWIQNWRI